LLVFPNHDSITAVTNLVRFLLFDSFESLLPIPPDNSSQSFSKLTCESVTTPPVCYCALLIHHQQGVSGNRALNTVIVLISLPSLDDNSIMGIEILLQYILLELSKL